VSETIACDGCARSVKKGEGADCVWTRVTFWCQSGVARVRRDYDLCPACQDGMVKRLKAIVPAEALRSR
jgi:hypothetical protein